MARHVTARRGVARRRRCDELPRGAARCLYSVAPTLHRHLCLRLQDILIEYVRGTCCAALNEAGRLGKLERDRASGATKLKVGLGPPEGAEEHEQGVHVL